MTAGLSVLVPLVGIVTACAALCVSRATYYRAKVQPPPPRPRPRPARALDDAERAQVLAVLDSERFVDQAPAQVYATLLDEGQRLCSIRTMYRVLAAAGPVRERRDQRRHPRHGKPQLVARAPNQVWSWDITKIPGPERGVWFFLYVVLDIFSRAVVGWTVAPTESAAVGEALIKDAAHRHGVQPGQLVVHTDRGSPMTARSMALLLADLGIIESHSRPRVSNDNPYSEAAFKTFKYQPTMPARFGSIQHARAFFAELFAWYNERHYHSGIALLTPADVHAGRAPAIIAARQTALDAAYREHPERFVHGAPTHRPLPDAAWINHPGPSVITIEGGLH